ncbi:hypothetical protein GCM10020366_28650 [Saccharopolyspora gregorii]|uniref:Uncharacterized protein n=1 Tax=Saccharopolyspora gregorii TaxID=33914 RepID=A0ABP6RRC5_9PSEU
MRPVTRSAPESGRNLLPAAPGGETAAQRGTIPAGGTRPRPGLAGGAVALIAVTGASGRRAPCLNWKDPCADWDS